MTKYSRKRVNIHARVKKAVYNKASQAARQAKFDALNSAPIRTGREIYHNVSNTYKNAKTTIDNTKKLAADLKEADGIKGKASILKDRALQNSKIADFANGFGNAKGFGAKAKFLGKRAAKGIANTEAAKKALDIANKLKKFANVLKAAWKPILITLAVLIVGGFLVIFITGISQSIGATPHFYCEIDAPDYIVDSALYQQYCARTYDSFILENLNGHYIIQDGSGPNQACAVHNMLLRFWCMNNINWYNLIWGADGQYPIDPESLIDFDNGAPNMRLYVIGGGYVEEESTARYSSSDMMNSSNFAGMHGMSEFNSANWGYLRDDTINVDVNDYSIDSELDTMHNDNWVWDLSVPNGCSWDLNISNMAVRGGPNGKGGMINLITHTNVWYDEQDLIDILQGNRGYKPHPEGIVVITTTGRAILVTGYDPYYMCADGTQGTFIVIDSALGLAGGFEGPIEIDAFCANIPSNPINNDMLRHPAGNIACWIEIDPLFENQGSATSGSRAGLGGVYAGQRTSRRPITDDPPECPYADAVVEFVTEVCSRNAPYVWGAEGPTAYDCSGLVRAAYRYASGGACDIPHYTEAMYGRIGVAISPFDIQPGDIIMTGTTYGDGSSHTLIYVGDIDGDGDADVAEAMGKNYGCVFSEYANLGRRGTGICEIIRITGPN